MTVDVAALPCLWVKNTFLEFGYDHTQEDEESDPWTVNASSPPRRQCTDSVLDCALRPDRFARPARTTHDNDPKLHLAKQPQQAPSAMARRHTESEPDSEESPAGASASSQGRPWGAAGARHNDEEDDGAIGDGVIDLAAQEQNAHTEDGEDSDDETIDMAARERSAIAEEAAAVAERRALMQRLEQNSLEIPVTGSGLAGRTTVMMRNIPCKYTQQKVMKEINHAGFLGRYDFFYLPVDPRNRCNRGFAFLNLDGPAAAEVFFQTFSGKKLRRFRSNKAIAVMPADLQGFERNAIHFATSQNSRKRNTEGGPLFFRSLPAACMGGGAPEQVGWEAPMAQTTESHYMGHQEYVACAQPWPMVAAPFAYTQWPKGMVAVAPQEQSVAQPQSTLTRSFCAMCGQPQAQHHLFCTFCGSKADR